MIYSPEVLTLYSVPLDSACGNPGASPDIASVPPACRSGEFYPFSLINDRYLAPPDQTPKIVADTLNDLFDQMDSGGHFSGLPASLSPDSRRSILKSIVLSTGLPFPRKNFWKEVEILKSAVADFAGIRNTDFQPFKRYNFDRCFTHRQHGYLVSTALPDGSIGKAVQKMSCGQKYCLWCRGQKRKKSAAEYVELAKALSSIKAISKVWSFVFTLPEAMEAASPDQEAYFRKKIPGIIKSVFGLKSRSNIGILIAVHPVGDSDLLRPRIHWHVSVFPCEFSKSEGFVPVDMRSVDIPRLHSLWADCFPVGTQVIPPETRFFTLQSAHDWARLGHRLRYDLRAFSTDIQNAILRVIPSAGVFILKRSNKNLLSWSAISSADLAQQYCYIFDTARLHAYGWIRRRASLIVDGILPVSLPDQPPTIIEQTDCIIEMVRATEYSKSRDQIVVRMDIFCYAAGIKLQIGHDIDFY